jgi:PAS domain S-box-containing protein
MPFDDTARQEASMDLACCEGRGSVAAELHLRNAALDAMATCIAIVDVRFPHHPYVFVNRAFAELQGQDAASLIGHPFRSMPVADASAAQWDAIVATIGRAEPLRTELLITQPSGRSAWFGMTLMPVRNAAGAVAQYVITGADITTRLEAERRKQELQDQLYAEMKERARIAIELRLAQKLESVGRLAAGVAHEINTPIQYIGDSIYFLRSAASDLKALRESYREALAAIEAGEPIAEVMPRVREAEDAADLPFVLPEVPRAFDRTLEGVERVASIVRAMKEFAHPDQSEQSPADINHAIETTLTVARNEYKYVAEVETDLQPLPPVVCNIGELNQVFLNLLVNAAHAIADGGKAQGGGAIRIRTCLVGAEAHIHLADNGCGIPPNHLERVFDPFFTTKEVGRGTGQGLAIARSIIVDKHAGSIDVHSVVGEGTEFLIRLPVAGRAREASE